MDPAEGQTPLYDADGARAFDRIAIEELGVPGIDLMRAAGRASDRVRRGRFAGLRRIVVAAGPGSNGGDGCEVARLAHAAGCAVAVLRVAERAPEREPGRAPETPSTSCRPASTQRSRRCSRPSSPLRAIASD